MAVTVEEKRVRVAAPAVAAPAPPGEPEGRSYLRSFVDSTSLNATRHVAALRPYRSDEFGSGPASPSKAHVEAANRLISRLRSRLRRVTVRLVATGRLSAGVPTTQNLDRLLRDKQASATWVKHVEKVWDYYFELFGQRQSRYANWLLATDRIALSCYQAVFTGLGAPRSIPSPAPFTYMATGFTPATVRRGVPFSRLGRRANPFPVVELPYSRLINPWTLGAVHHEVSHNLQWDLGLWRQVPERIRRQLLKARVPAAVAEVWARWNKEIWADLAGLLLCGPGFVASLMEVVALPPESAMAFNPRGVHPTPYLRVPISLALLERMGFVKEAEAYWRVWRRMYPRADSGTIPPAVIESFPRARRLVVDTVCFQPYEQLGGKSLAGVVQFTPVHWAMVQEAGTRIASGTDPGIIPERFLVGAVRFALDSKLASPDELTANFYDALERR
jgi:hypothetical protein